MSCPTQRSISSNHLNLGSLASRTRAGLRHQSVSLKFTSLPAKSTFIPLALSRLRTPPPVLPPFGYPRKARSPYPNSRSPAVVTEFTPYRFVRRLRRRSPRTRARNQSLIQNQSTIATAMARISRRPIGRWICGRKNSLVTVRGELVVFDEGKSISDV